MILSVNGTPIQAYNETVWAKNANYAKLNPQTSFELFRALRASNVALLKSIPKKMWKYFGMHEERGRETIRRVAQMYAGHDVNHVRQIERILG
jgi:hypothetical protein